MIKKIPIGQISLAIDSREAEVLSNANYEVVEVITESKYNYVSKHKELLFMADDLDTYEAKLKKQVVCRIKVKEV